MLEMFPIYFLFFFFLIKDIVSRETACFASWSVSEVLMGSLISLSAERTLERGTPATRGLRSPSVFISLPAPRPPCPTSQGTRYLPLLERGFLRVLCILSAQACPLDSVSSCPPKNFIQWVIYSVRRGSAPATPLRF